MSTEQERLVILRDALTTRSELSMQQLADVWEELGEPIVRGLIDARPDFEAAAQGTERDVLVESAEGLWRVRYDPGLEAVRSGPPSNLVEMADGNMLALTPGYLTLVPGRCAVMLLDRRQSTSDKWQMGTEVVRSVASFRADAAWLRNAYATILFAVLRSKSWIEMIPLVDYCQRTNTFRLDPTAIDNRLAELKSLAEPAQDE